MKLIPLINRRGVLVATATVDDEDFERLSCHKWRLAASGYAVRGDHTLGRYYAVYMHREITNCPDGLCVDHISHDKRDNRKDNLRVVDYSESAANTRIRCDNTSGHKGVYFDKRDHIWYVRIHFRGKRTNLGRHKTKEAAILAYQKEAPKVHGEYACLG